MLLLLLLLLWQFDGAERQAEAVRVREAGRAEAQGRAQLQAAHGHRAGGQLPRSVCVRRLGRAPAARQQHQQQQSSSGSHVHRRRAASHQRRRRRRRRQFDQWYDRRKPRWQSGDRNDNQQQCKCDEQGRQTSQEWDKPRGVRCVQRNTTTLVNRNNNNNNSDE